ncbi:hypothetical protein IG193_02050 [Infirmifilum lucidum]|uniref:Thymidylate kinase n=1 Tax=Infirmifilum lucidum TaxID=2776706 RepID=A0A7L9FHG3_9CREN|nr:hypothetical protein [Infirmifilum lucidum]QOJ79268.1 hypothetical protein IG193_02050 [Infirmifilum lucidum]
MIICLFGPDGSGKSSLARVLAEVLTRRGFRVRVSWMRGTHTLASLLAVFLSRFWAFRGRDNPYYNISIPRKMRRLWQLLEFASVIPVILSRFILPRLLGYCVIAERYLPDFIVWVSLTTRDVSYLRSLEARFLLALSEKASVKVYVRASEAELAKRRNDVGSGFIVKQLELYDKIAKAINAQVIDTTGKTVAESARILYDLVKQCS